jgi:hypothetical protein
MIESKIVNNERYYSTMDEKSIYYSKEEAQKHEDHLTYLKREKTVDNIKIAFGKLRTGKLFFARDTTDLKGITDSWYSQSYHLIDPIKEYPCWLYDFHTYDSDGEEAGYYVCTLEYLEKVIFDIQNVIDDTKSKSVSVAQKLGYNIE